MKTEELEVGKVYECPARNRYLILNKIKRGKNDHVNCIYLSQSDGHQTCCRMHPVDFIKLSDDQSHNISIHIEPNLPEKSELEILKEKVKELEKKVDFFFFNATQGGVSLYNYYKKQLEIINENR